MGAGLVVHIWNAERNFTVLAREVKRDPEAKHTATIDGKVVEIEMPVHHRWWRGRLAGYENDTAVHSAVALHTSGPTVCGEIEGELRHGADAWVLRKLHPYHPLLFWCVRRSPLPWRLRPSLRALRAAEP